MCKSEIFAETINLVSQETEIPAERILPPDKDAEFVEPGVIPVTVKCNFGEWHLRLPYNN